MLKKIFEIRNRIIERKLELKQFPKRLAFYKTFVKPGDLIFDIGANIGNRIAIFLEIGAKVVAVEPQPYCNNILKKKFSDKIMLEQVCLGESVYETEMYISNESTLSTLSKKFIERTGSTRFVNNNWDTKISVQVNTLDNLIHKYGKPKFCKIDVEGFEEEVLKGLTISIPALSFEYCVPEMNDNLLNCIKQLNRINNTGKFNYSVQETMELALPFWVDYTTMLKIVAEDSFAKTLFGDIYFKN
jgi:FkbM family methyltransferase